MNEKNDSFLPVWAWVIVAVQIALVLFYSAGTAMNPGDFIPGVALLIVPALVAILYLWKRIW